MCSTISSPDVLNEFVSHLGLDLSKLSFCDIFGLDEVRQCLSLGQHIRLHLCLDADRVQECCAASLPG